MTRPLRYTIIHALDAWHVYDTHRAAPVAFSATRTEELARALAATYNHYWHLTLEEAHADG